MNATQRRRRQKVITAEERRMIDEAVAQGRVTRIPTGASVFERKYVWKERRRDVGRLVEVMGDGTRKPGHYWRQQIASEQRLAKARNDHQK